MEIKVCARSRIWCRTKETDGDRVLSLSRVEGAGEKAAGVMPSCSFRKGRGGGAIGTLHREGESGIRPALAESKAKRAPEGARLPYG